MSLGGSIGQAAYNWPEEGTKGAYCLTRKEGNEKVFNEVTNIKGEWEVINCKVDSGAVDWVTNPETGKMFPVEETTASKKGVKYVAANGTDINNHGERKMKGLTDDWSPVEVAMQVADVKSTLGSVWRMTQAGNRVVFGDNDGTNFIQNKRTGRTRMLREDNGSFEFDLWVPVKKGAPHVKKVDEVEVVTKNQYQALGEDRESRQSESNFHWLEELF